MDISTILKVLSDENRLRILNILKEYSLCVGEIQTILCINQSNVSRHLEKLKISGLIKSYKKAQWVYYELFNEQLEEFSFIKELLFKNIKKELIFKEDLLKLQKYKVSSLCCQDLKKIGFDYNQIKF